MTRRIEGYDYRLRQSVSLTRGELQHWVNELHASGGRTVRHRLRNAGDDDLLLIRRGRIIAEFYDHDQQQLGIVPSLPAGVAAGMAADEGARTQAR